MGLRGEGVEPPGRIGRRGPEDTAAQLPAYRASGGSACCLPGWIGVRGKDLMNGPGRECRGESRRSGDSRHGTIGTRGSMVNAAAGPCQDEEVCSVMRGVQVGLESAHLVSIRLFTAPSGREGVPSRLRTRPRAAPKPAPVRNCCRPEYPGPASTASPASAQGKRRATPKMIGQRARDVVGMPDGGSVRMTQHRRSDPGRPPLQGKGTGSTQTKPPRGEGFLRTHLRRVPRRCRRTALRVGHDCNE